MRTSIASGRAAPRAAPLPLVGHREKSSLPRLSQPAWHPSGPRPSTGVGVEHGSLRERGALQVAHVAAAESPLQVQAVALSVREPTYEM